MHHTWAYAWYWWRVSLSRPFFFLTPDADLHLAQPPLPSTPDFVGTEHKTGFHDMLRAQFVMQPASTIAKQSHLRSWNVRLVVIHLENEKRTYSAEDFEE